MRSSCCFDTQIIQDGRGRRARSTCKNAAGSVVCDTLPFAAVLFSKLAARYCSFCFRRSADLKRCSGGCGLGLRPVFFCDTTCQKQAWGISSQDGSGGGHKFECGANPRRGMERSLKHWNAHHAGLLSAPFPDDEVALLRSVFFKCAVMDGQKLDPSSSPSAVPRLPDEIADLAQNLSPNPAGISPSSSPSYQVCVAAARSLFSQEEEECGSADTFGAAVSFFLSLEARFRANNFAILSPPLMVPIGQGVYPTAAILNHSCKPNCILSYSSFGQQTIRLLHPVPPGTELTHSYVDLLSPRSQRQLELQKDYGFLCACERCQDSFDALDDLSLTGLALPSASAGPRRATEEAKIQALLRDATRAFEDDDFEGEHAAIQSAVLAGRKAYAPLNKILYDLECRALSASMLVLSVLDSSPASSQQRRRAVLSRAVDHCRHVLSYLEAALGGVVPFHHVLNVQRITLIDLLGGSDDDDDGKMKADRKALANKVLEGLRVTVGGAIGDAANFARIEAILSKEDC